jgi:hypothetical protein
VLTVLVQLNVSLTERQIAQTANNLTEHTCSSNTVCTQLSLMLEQQVGSHSRSPAAVNAEQPESLIRATLTAYQHKLPCQAVIIPFSPKVLKLQGCYAGLPSSSACVYGLTVCIMHQTPI